MLVMCLYFKVVLHPCIQIALYISLGIKSHVLSCWRFL